MQKTAFYIVERAQPSGERGEVKETEPDPTEGLAPIEASVVLIWFFRLWGLKGGLGWGWGGSSRFCFSWHACNFA